MTEMKHLKLKDQLSKFLEKENKVQKGKSLDVMIQEKIKESTKLPEANLTQPQEGTREASREKKTGKEVAAEED